jgi:Zn-dependent protease
MTDSKPWYTSVTLWGLVLALVGHFLRGGDLLGAEGQELLSQILTYGGISAAGYGRVRASTTLRAPKSGEGGFASVGLLATVGGLALVVAWLLGACTTTYTGATSRTALQAHGASGTTAVLTVDGHPVCTVTGTQSTLRVDAGTAARICAAHAESGCRWTP